MKNVLISFLFLSSIINAFSSPMKKEDQNKVWQGDTTKIREKIYLHIDRSLYNIGDDIWYKVYLVNANNIPETLSKVVYVELIDPDCKILVTKTIRVNNGGGEGDFKIPNDFKSGEYTIRAYTNFMRNFDDTWFFNKKIHIFSLNGKSFSSSDSTTGKIDNLPGVNANIILKPDLQFFPDGGYLVDDLVNQIGFKAIGADGKGIDLSGAIVDNLGEHILDFANLKYGMGVLKFVPLKNRIYKAIVGYNGIKYTYDLPISLPIGATMLVIEHKESYSVIVHSTLPTGVNGFKLIGRQKNMVVSSSEIISNTDKTKITVPKNILEQGIVQFTLCDQNRNPLCERLVFVDTDNAVSQMNISLSKKDYGKRELAELEINFDQLRLHNPNMSMSVTNISALDTGMNNSYIKSYLLLNSELRGDIEHSNYYFKSDDPQRKKVLDLLMLTQGWRQYIVNDTLKIDGEKLKYPVETGVNIKGSVKRFSVNGKPAKAEVSIIFRDKGKLADYQTETNEQGHFVFDGIDFNDSTSIIIQAKTLNSGKDSNIKNPNDNFYITLDSLVTPKVSSKGTPKYQNPVETNIIYHENSLTTAEIDSILRSQNRHILLDEVTVTAKKIEKMSKKRTIYFEPSNSMDFEEVRKGTAARNILEAIEGRIAGVNISGEDIAIREPMRITEKGGVNMGQPSGPLFLLDGMPVSKDAILSIPVNQVDFIDVLKGPRTTIFGSAGSHGVIAVYTLTASDNLNNNVKIDKKCILNFIHQGYSQTRKFYEPVYSLRKPDNNKPDYRTTIYWNPNVMVEKTGKISISFYTSDVPATYKVELEGISPDGKPISTDAFFQVK